MRKPEKEIKAEETQRIMSKIKKEGKDEHTIEFEGKKINSKDFMNFNF